MITKGSYFNRMLHCGGSYNQWVENALKYLPQKILFDFKERMAFYSTAEKDGCRLAKDIRENREIILLSERVLPKLGAKEDDTDVRYFIYVILHEVAHAVKQHQRPERLTPEENEVQEKEADELALQWFNDHIKEQDNIYLKPLTHEEVEYEKEKNQGLMTSLYLGMYKFPRKSTKSP